MLVGWVMIIAGVTGQAALGPAWAGVAISFIGGQVIVPIAMRDRLAVVPGGVFNAVAASGIAIIALVVFGLTGSVNGLWPPLALLILGGGYALLALMRINLAVARLAADDIRNLGPQTAERGGETKVEPPTAADRRQEVHWNVVMSDRREKFDRFVVGDEVLDSALNKRRGVVAAIGDRYDDEGRLYLLRFEDATTDWGFDIFLEPWNDERLRFPITAVCGRCTHEWGLHRKQESMWACQVCACTDFGGTVTVPQR